MKKTKIKKQKLLSRAEYKYLAERFAGCLTFALKFMDAIDGKGIMMKRDKTGKTTAVVHWSHDFCDALKEAGVEVDRDALYKMRKWA